MEQREMVSIVIPNRNRKDLLVRCLDSIEKQSYKGVEVIVVDNGSSDGSKRTIIEKYPKVKLIANHENDLFCRAQNQAIKIAQGKYVISLNNDVVLKEDFIDETVKAAELDSKIGMVSGKVMRMDAKTLDSTGLFLGRSRKPIERGYGKIDVGQYESPGHIFGVGGAVAFFRREMLEDIRINGEYFDEDYGMFYEDLDLCWRAQRKGWKAYYSPSALAYHIRGATARRHIPNLKILKGFQFAWLDERLQFLLVRNRYTTIIKNDTVADFLKNLAYILLYELKLWGYLLLFRPKVISRLVKEIGWLKRAFKKRSLLACQ